MSLLLDNVMQQSGFSVGSRAQVVVGLVNNMPGAAQTATDEQFCGLLAAASEGVQVVVKFFAPSELSFPNCPPRPDGRRYASLDALETTRIDGLIVTGTPPRANSLVEEPFWAYLQHLVDITRERGISTVWSCLAAHAAVLHADGIDRRPLSGKASGLFECERVESEHPIMKGAPQRWRVPHSRYNGLPADALVACGYQILSVSADVGVDIFTKRFGALSVFFQGHPEYHASTLLSEYRRDVERFLSGKRESYPDMPRSYFQPPAVAVLMEFRHRALRRRDVRLLSAFPTIGCNEEAAQNWRLPAVQVFSNWIAYLASRRHPASRTLDARAGSFDDQAA